MAKMVKCPTCGTPIEVPPQASGQVVKCPGCGKGLKLVAKKPSVSPSAGSPASAGGSMAGGSLSGASISAMTYAGESLAPPPAMDDLPSLDSNCAVCGRPTDPEQLVEDNGRLVCPDCIKGARSGIARPDRPPEILDFAAAATASRRSKMINITPGFLIGAVAVLVLISCQIYLSLITRPVGTAIARPIKPTPTAVVPPKTGVEPSTAPVDSTAQSTDPTSAAPKPEANQTPPAPSSGVVVSTTGPGEGTATAPPTTGPNVVIAQGPLTTPPPSEGGTKSIFNDPDTATTPPPDGVVPPPPPPAIAAADPLERGIERLMALDYKPAATALELARAKYVVRNLDRPLDARQMLVLEGLAASYIGQGKPELAQPAIDLAYKGGDRSRSLVLNRAIASAVKKTVTLEQLAQAAFDLRTYLQGTPGDDYAADIMGMLLARASSMPGAERNKVDPLWTFLDTYNDRDAEKTHPGKLKWGVEWLAAEEVKLFRPLRFTAGSAAAGLSQAARELEIANTRHATVQRNLELAQAAKARGVAVDLQGAQNQFDAATAIKDKAQKNFDEASASLKYKKPRWLEKFEPVLPEPTAAK
jgi:hypothetical protein